MKDGDSMTYFNKVADEMRRIKPFEDESGFWSRVEGRGYKVDGRG